jgi:UDP-N-acetylmuramate dehydrogenase
MASAGRAPTDTAALERAEAILRQGARATVEADHPLAPLTTFRVGGPAALYLEAQSEADLVAAGRAMREAGVAVAILGKGSNVLVSDEGFPGLVIRLGKAYRWSTRDGQMLRAGGAMPLPALAGVALRHALTGLEFGVAIPATLGGAVRMNAGAHRRSMDEVVESIEVFRLQTGETHTIEHADAGFVYRRSGLPADAVVVGAALALTPGEPDSIRALMDEARTWRRATQPLAEPNCGSVFKNPPDGHAASLIESLGGKDAAVGGARVSTKHANFIVTAPGARSADVVELIRRLQQMVADRYGVRLEPEVHLVGRFDVTPS